MTIMEALPPTVCHSFHQKHELKLVTTRPSGFLCGGCKQFGQGPEQYRCEECDFDLHARCATAPAVVDHALFEGRRFTLLENYTTQNGDMFCRACGRESVGLRYNNPDLNLYLHPCCTCLPKRIFQDGHAFDLCNDALEPRNLVSSKKCRLCNERSEKHSLSYRCNYRHGGPVYLHVPCLVNAHNEQTGQENWQASAPITAGVLRTFTRKRDAANKAIVGLAKIGEAAATLVTGVYTLCDSQDDPTE